MIVLLAALFGAIAFIVAIGIGLSMTTRTGLAVVVVLLAGVVVGAVLIDRSAGRCHREGTCENAGLAVVMGVGNVLGLLSGWGFGTAIRTGRDEG